jgi:hypothetical protein
MMDRLLICTLQLTIIGLICGCGVGSVLTGYHGLLQLLARQFAPGVGWLALSLALGVFAYQLCRHRHDLVDR